MSGRKSRRSYPYGLIALGLVAIGLVLALLLGAARVVGAPGEGERVAARYGIPRPAIIAHRGASHLAPESTRPAYLLARELGADYLELDLQRTKDGVLVATHDDDLRRTTDVATVFLGREKDEVSFFTFAELQQLDAGSWFNERFPDRARRSFVGLKVLRLVDVLDIAEDWDPPPGLYIETKLAGQFPGIEEQLVRILVSRGWIRPPPAGGTQSGQGERRPVKEGKVIFQSFDPTSLAKLKELAPGVPRLLLLDEVMLSDTGWEKVLSEAKDVAMGIGTWGYHWSKSPSWSVETTPDRYMATWPWYTGKAHRAGLLVHPWTIDDRWEMWMVLIGGADGVFTNRPEVALRTVGRARYDDLDPLWDKIGY